MQEKQNVPREPHRRHELSAVIWIQSVNIGVRQSCKSSESSAESEFLYVHQVLTEEIFQMSLIMNDKRMQQILK